MQSTSSHPHLPNLPTEYLRFLHPWGSMMRMCYVYQELIQCLVTNVPHMKGPFYPETYVGGVTTIHFTIWQQVSKKKEFIMFSYKIPTRFHFFPLFSHIHSFILCKAGKSWNFCQFLFCFPNPDISASYSPPMPSQLLGAF